MATQPHLITPAPHTTDRSAIMRRAWEIARARAAQFGGSAREYLSAATAQAWAETTKTDRTDDCAGVEMSDSKKTAYICLGSSSATQPSAGQHYFTGAYSPMSNATTDRSHKRRQEAARQLIARAGLSQRAAARALGISERQMRSYLADPSASTAIAPPPYVELALVGIVARLDAAADNERLTDLRLPSDKRGAARRILEQKKLALIKKCGTYGR